MMSSISGASGLSALFAVMRGVDSSQQFALGGSTSTDSTDSTDSTSSTSSSDSTTSTDLATSLFNSLDSNGDGSVSQTEFSDAIAKLSDQLSAQFQQGKTHGAHGGHGGHGAPPPADGGDGNDQGFTADQLTSMASDLSSSDPQRASLMSSIADNFSTADTNGDGKVDRQEAMAYQATYLSGTDSTASTASADGSAATTVASTDASGGCSASTGSSDSSSSSSGDSTASSDALLAQLMQLVQNYLSHSQSAVSSTSTGSTLSVAA